MPSIHSTLGALEVGVLLMLLLFGIMIAQAYAYYQSQSTTDNRILRILVPLVIITETVHTGLMCADFYITSISDYGNITTIDADHWTGVFAQPVSSLSIGMIQCFYAWRIRCISQRWPITLISWLGSAVHVGTAICVAVVSDGIPLLSTLLGKYRWLVCVCVSAAVAVDVLNTTAFCYWLCKRKSDFRQPISHGVLNVLIRWTIETGMLTFIVTSLELVFFLVLPNTFLFLCFISFGTKVYSNSLLALLNGRSALIEKSGYASGVMDMQPLTVYSGANTPHVSSTMTDRFTMSMSSFPPSVRVSNRSLV